MERLFPKLKFLGQARSLFFQIFKKGDEIIFDCVTKIYRINRQNQKKTSSFFFEKKTGRFSHFWNTFVQKRDQRVNPQIFSLIWIRYKNKFRTRSQLMSKEFTKIFWVYFFANWLYWKK